MIYLKPRRAAGKSTGSNLALTLSLCKQRIQPRGRLFLYAGQHMGIRIHRQRDRRVSKPLLYDLRVLEQLTMALRFPLPDARSPPPIP